MDRFFVLSEARASLQVPSPLDDRLTDTSLDQHIQLSQTSQTRSSQTKVGWSLTITVTPTGLILATSIAVNVDVAVMWLRQEVEGV